MTLDLFDLLLDCSSLLESRLPDGLRFLSDLVLSANTNVAIAITAVAQAATAVQSVVFTKRLCESPRIGGLDIQPLRCHRSIIPVHSGCGVGIVDPSGRSRDRNRCNIPRLPLPG